MAVPTVNTLSLCTGYAGLERGLKLAGIRTRLVAACERDPYAAAVLVARMEESALDQAPIWDCLETFPGEQFAGLVDLITCGFSCQPWSTAGKRLGADDDRWLWPNIAKIIRTVGPSYVFLENVRGLMGGGIDLVLGDLADLGFDAQWDLFSASDIGAPHKRERLWILAYRNGERLRGERVSLRGAFGGTEAERRCEDVANASGEGRQQVARGSSSDEVATLAEDVVYAQGIGQREPDNQTSTVTRQDAWQGAGGGCSGFPPRPDDAAGWDEWRRQGGPEPSIRRGADGTPSGMVEHSTTGRPDRLHLLGNGVVPQCAAFAFTTLAKRAGLM